jgi:hypothetical protein
MMTIQEFVKEALLKGESRERIRQVLLKTGWQEDEISNALNDYADVNFSIPVPKRKPYISAQEAFMYLLLFLTLYISAISFGTLLFQFIQHWLPDNMNNGYGYSMQLSTVRQSTASIIIAYPLFLWMTSHLRSAIKKDPEKRASKIRKWLTYITLFIAAGVIIGDLITLIFNLLSGDMTLRFILKVLTVGGIAGLIFGYYLWDMKRDHESES